MSLIAGFTFVRNARRYDYPVIESIRSMLPLCGELVVAVGRSDDDTMDMVRRINDPKIRILETVWDDSLRQGGRVLAVETDKAFGAVSPHYPWCLYLQADECLHEQDYDIIRAAAENYQHDVRTEGFLFSYHHFYGSYDYVGNSRRWYRREVRIVRNDPAIHSWRDAQGFRRKGKKLRVRLLPAHIYHYGWVRHPEQQQQRQAHFHTLWHDDQTAQAKAGSTPYYIYDQGEPLRPFTGTHPATMCDRIQRQNWHFANDPTQMRLTFKDRCLHWLEQKTGYRLGEYRNYTLL